VRHRRDFLSVLAICTLLALSFAMSTSAGAQTISSAYTSTAPKDCRAIGARASENGIAARICLGKAGLVVLVNEDDTGSGSLVRAVRCRRQPRCQHYRPQGR
jgi:hypothetical protein